MTTPGFFEIYPDARPALPAGLYTTTTHQDLTAAPPHGADGNINVDDTKFFVHIEAPRYVMPPGQILSTFPPAGSQGDWRERLPQIVLKRRTLPWERNPGPLTAPPIGPPSPDPDPATAPPWLALVVIADGEGQLSADVDVAQCVTSGVNLGPDADVPQGKFLEVSKDVIDKVFPCLDELQLLTHVRKVDLRDTELALGDDDGYLAVVLSSRLPQPGPPLEPGGEPTPMKYTACLINLEQQLPKLLPTEPTVTFHFDAIDVSSLVVADLLKPAANATVDQLAMNLGPAASALSKKGTKTSKAAGQAVSAAPLAPYAPGPKLETAAASWSTGPVAASLLSSGDLGVVAEHKFGRNSGILGQLSKRFRFPVLVSWEFTCTGSGGFERLMNTLDVGLLGTLDEGQPPPVPEVAVTGHVALSHRTRRGESARSWYRGPLGPQPTQRVLPKSGVLPLAHTGDQLRKVVPDGREDISLAAMFEIGRLLTLSKPALVASLMQWRRDLFGAARARELSDLLTGALFAGFGKQAIGGRNALEDLIRTSVVGAFTGMKAGALAPGAQQVTASRVPAGLADFTADAVLLGLGADPKLVRRATKQFGAEGLSAMTVPVAASSVVPVSKDKNALSALQTQLAARVDQLTAATLRLEPGGTAPVGTAPDKKKDSLDQLIAQASAAVKAASEGGRL